MLVSLYREDAEKAIYLISLEPEQKKMDEDANELRNSRSQPDMRTPAAKPSSSASPRPSSPSAVTWTEISTSHAHRDARQRRTSRRRVSTASASEVSDAGSSAPSEASSTGSSRRVDGSRDYETGAIASFRRRRTNSACSGLRTSLSAGSLVLQNQDREMLHHADDLGLDLELERRDSSRAKETHITTTTTTTSTTTTTTASTDKESESLASVKKKSSSNSKSQVKGRQPDDGDEDGHDNGGSSSPWTWEWMGRSFKPVLLRLARRLMVLLAWYLALACLVLGFATWAVLGDLLANIGNDNYGVVVSGTTAVPAPPPLQAPESQPHTLAAAFSEIDDMVLTPAERLRALAGCLQSAAVDCPNNTATWKSIELHAYSLGNEMDAYLDTAREARALLGETAGSLQNLLSRRLASAEDAYKYHHQHHNRTAVLSPPRPLPRVLATAGVAKTGATSTHHHHGGRPLSPSVLDLAVQTPAPGTTGASRRIWSAYEIVEWVLETTLPSPLRSVASTVLGVAYMGRLEAAVSAANAYTVISRHVTMPLNHLNAGLVAARSSLQQERRPATTAQNQKHQHADVDKSKSKSNPKPGHAERSSEFVSMIRNDARDLCGGGGSQAKTPPALALAAPALQYCRNPDKNAEAECIRAVERLCQVQHVLSELGAAEVVAEGAARLRAALDARLAELANIRRAALAAGRSATSNVLCFPRSRLLRFCAWLVRLYLGVGAWCF